MFIEFVEVVDERLEDISGFLFLTFLSERVNGDILTSSSADQAVTVSSPSKELLLLFVLLSALLVLLVLLVLLAFSSSSSSLFSVLAKAVDDV